MGDGDPHRHPLGTLRAVPLQPRRGWGEGDPRGLGTFRAVPPRLAPLAVFPLDTFRAVPPPPRWGGGAMAPPRDILWRTTSAQTATPSVLPLVPSGPYHRGPGGATSSWTYKSLRGRPPSFGFKGQKF